MATTREKKKERIFRLRPRKSNFEKATTSQSSYQQREHVQWTKVTDENIDKKSECL